MFPACYFANIACRFRCPFGPSAPQPYSGLPRRKAGSTLLARSSFPNLLHDRSPNFCSPAGFLHPSGSKLPLASQPHGPPSDSARSPFAPHSHFLFKSGLRIIVPGPLRFRRLAVPQTSWNLLHYDPEALLGQRDFDCV